MTSILDLGPGGTLQSLYYTYDDDGQRTRIVREDDTRIYFGYDAAHRLTGEDWLDNWGAALYAFAYEYDAAGNRLKKTFNGEVTYYDYNTLNQLTTERVLGGDATYYTWTDDGAMATKQEVAGWTYYTWDVDESLTKIEAPDVTLANKYNARMQRVARDEDGDAETLIYDSQKLIAEAASGSLLRYYLSEGGSVYSPLVSQLGSQHWFLFDALGSTLGLTNDAGGLSDTFKYEAFGTSLGRTGTTATPYQYVGGCGYYSGGAIELVQLWQRWLALADGRFVSRDPLPPDGYRGYVYVRNWPTRFIDPSGLQAEPDGHYPEDDYRGPSADPIIWPPDWLTPGLIGYEACLASCLATGVTFGPPSDPDVSIDIGDIMERLLRAYGDEAAFWLGLMYFKHIKCDRRFIHGRYSKILKRISGRVARWLPYIGQLYTIYSAYDCARRCYPWVNWDLQQEYSLM